MCFTLHIYTEYVYTVVLFYNKCLLFNIFNSNSTLIRSNNSNRSE